MEIKMKTENSNKNKFPKPQKSQLKSIYLDLYI